VLLIAVVTLFVDALVYSGAYTQSAAKHVSTAADQLVEFVGRAVDYGPGAEGGP
jgi:hypothetical protein